MALNRARAPSPQLLINLGPLTAWILESAPAHLVTLSATRKRDIKAVEVECRDAYDGIGVMIVRQHILQILICVFQELQLTEHLMRLEGLYEYGRKAAPDVWDAIFATCIAKSVVVGTGFWTGILSPFFWAGLSQITRFWTYRIPAAVPVLKGRVKK